MRHSKMKIGGMPSIRIPVAPPGKVMASTRDYDRKKQKQGVLQEIEKQKRMMKCDLL